VFTGQLGTARQLATADVLGQRVDDSFMFQSRDLSRHVRKIDLRRILGKNGVLLDATHRLP
jgi:hypothetical protein